MNKPAELSFFPLAVVIARAQAAPILAKVADRGSFEDDAMLEGKHLNYVEQVDAANYRREQMRDEP